MVKKYYNFFALGIFFLIWAWSWLNAADPKNWMSENHLVFIFFPILLWLVWHVRISKLSFTLILIFLVLHIIGARYNYGFVPFGDEIGYLLGTTNNSYDRFVHFFSGVLMIYPIRELFMRITGNRGYWSYYFSFAILLSFSALYEIMEWITVLHLDAYAGSLFIGGTDPLDAPKDMFMSAIGALIAIFAIMLISRFYKKIKSNK